MAKPSGGTMPLTNLDPNVARPSSRSSNFSFVAKDANGLPLASNGAMLEGNSGVLSMLKTSTETGDLGPFSVASNPLQKLPKSLHHFPGDPGPSRTSSHYSRKAGSRNGSVHGSIRSVRSGKSQRGIPEASFRGAWPHSHHHYAMNQDFLDGSVDSQSSLAHDGARSLAGSRRERYEPTDRSYSMTQTLPFPGGLSGHRSLTSLRNQEAGSSPHSPLSHTSHFRHPGYRPSSPALSDSAAAFRPSRFGPRRARDPRFYAASPFYSPAIADLQPQNGAPAGLSQVPRPIRHIEDLQRPFMNLPLNPGPRPSQPVRRHINPLPLHRPLDHAGYGPPLPHPQNFSPAPPLSQNEQTGAWAPRSELASTAPYVGFVQRVKNALEERMSSEDVTYPSRSFKRSGSPVTRKAAELVHASDTTTPPFDRLQSEAQSEYVVITEPKTEFVPAIVETEEAPLETTESIPLHTVGDAQEEPAQTSPIVKRLTRDLIKAGIEESSEAFAGSDVASDINQDHVVDVGSEAAAKHSVEDGAISTSKGGSIEIARSVPLSQNPGDLSSSTSSMCTSQDATTTNPLDITELRLQYSSPDIGAPGISESNVQASADTKIEELFNKEPSKSQNKQESKKDPNSSISRPSSEPLRSAFSRLKERARRGSLARSLPPASLNRALSALDTPAQSKPKPQSVDMDAIEQSSGLAKPNKPHNVSVATKSSTDDARRSSTSLSLSVDRTSRASRVGAQDDTGRTRHQGLDHESLADEKDVCLVQQSHFSPPTEDAVNTRRASIVPDKITSDAPVMPSSMSRNSYSTPDSRISAVRNFHLPLPDLTEDSQEDCSTTNLRMLGPKAPVFKPRTQKDVRPIRHPFEVAESAETPRTYFNRTLADTHNIPSFNFSRLDLTAKLNMALGLRSSRSFEDLSQQGPNQVEHLSQERPSSASAVRERYRSFFAFSGEDGGEEEYSVPQDLTVNSVFNDELLHEIDRLSIPSVRNLTMRLSRLLPTIKYRTSLLDLEKVDEVLRETTGDYHGLGTCDPSVHGTSQEMESTKPERSAVKTAPATLAGTGSQRAGSKKLRRQSIQLMKELPPLPSDSKRVSKVSSIGRPLTVISIHGSDRGAPSELDGTPVEATLDRGQSGELLERSSARLKLKDKDHMVFLASSNAKPRPWNEATGSPSSDEEQTFDVTLSKAVAEPSSPPTDEEAKSSGRSDSGLKSPSDETVRIVRSMSPGFDANLIPKTDLLSDNDKHSVRKEGVLSSLGRKIGLKPRIDQSGFAIDPHFLHPEERTVDPGDRYPTTGLSSPAGVNIDESRSYFSDDSSLSDHRVSMNLRKRLTRLKAKRSRNEVSSGLSANGSCANVVDALGPDDTLFLESPAGLNTQVSAHEQPPAGMPKAEFRAKRLLEKLRCFLYRGGERLKHLGKHKRHHQDDWHDSNEYIIM